MRCRSRRRGKKHALHTSISVWWMMASESKSKLNYFIPNHAIWFPFTSLGGLSHCIALLHTTLSFSAHSTGLLLPAIHHHHCHHSGPGRKKTPLWWWWLFLLLVIVSFGGQSHFMNGRMQQMLSGQQRASSYRYARDLKLIRGVTHIGQWTPNTPGLSTIACITR